MWYLGEDSHEYENGQDVGTSGSWEYGVDGALPGIVMPADPTVGDAYRQEYYAGEAEDMGEILDVGISYSIGLGDYDDVVVTEDWNPLEPDVIEHKWYARDIGMIAEADVAGGDERAELVEFTPEAEPPTWPFRTESAATAHHRDEIESQIEEKLMKRSTTIAAAATVALGGVAAAGLTVANAASGDDGPEDDGADTAITGEAMQRASEVALARTGGGRSRARRSTTKRASTRSRSPWTTATRSTSSSTSTSTSSAPRTTGPAATTDAADAPRPSIAIPVRRVSRIAGAGSVLRSGGGGGHRGRRLRLFLGCVSRSPLRIPPLSSGRPGSGSAPSPAAASSFGRRDIERAELVPSRCCLLVGREERLEAELLGGHVDGRADRRDDGEPPQRASPKLNSTSITGTSGAIERGVANTPASAPVRTRSTSSAVVTSITPPTASRRARSSSAGATSSQFSTADRTGPGSSSNRNTLAGSGTGSGAHSPANRRAAPVVHPHDVPLAVHHDRRVRRMLLEHAVQRASAPARWPGRRCHARSTSGEAGRHQQAVALAQRDVEGDGEAQHHLTARLRSPRLDEAHVARCRRGRDREVELAHPAHTSPVPHDVTEGRGAASRDRTCHVGDATPTAARCRFPRGESPVDGEMRMIDDMNLTVLTPAEAPAASRPILDDIAADLGFVPNLAAVTAASPTLLSAFDALRRTVAEPTFPPVHREIAGVAVGVAVDNAYGVAFHSTVLASLGGRRARDRSDALRVGAQRPCPRRDLRVRPRRPVGRGKVGDDVLRRAYDAGLTDADLLQLVAECVFAGLVGTIDNLADRVPLDDFLEPRRWKSD